jgi:hypothetical protein
MPPSRRFRRACRLHLVSNGHGVSATPENISRCRHDRFPHPGPLPEGEGNAERTARDFHGNDLPRRGANHA